MKRPFFRKLLPVVLLLLLPWISTACYSFTGSSLLPETKTLQIVEFVNNAPLSNPTLAQQFTIDLNKRFLQRTQLKGTTTNPDVLISGEITSYIISPTTISAPVNVPGGVIQAAQNKLTITMRVHYENKQEPEKGFDKTYSDEAVFASTLSTLDIENSQVRLVNERLINKIFNDIVANW